MTTNEVGILPDLTNEGISSASHIFVAQSPNFLRKVGYYDLLQDVFSVVTFWISLDPFL